MTEPRVAYLVVSNCYEGVDVNRVYLDRAAAEAFVAAYNATDADGYLEIEEKEIGAPAEVYDGPIWSVTWSPRRKLRGEKQLLLVGDGFTIVVPSAVPNGTGYSFQEYFAPRPPVEYEDPPVWIDRFFSTQDWESGEHPGEAKLTNRTRHEVTARGTSKESCEALVRAHAVEVKAEFGIA